MGQVCGDMIEARRSAMKADPKSFENDGTALTMLVADRISEDDPRPFFSQHLAVSTCIGFLNAAFDTTHSTLFWIFYHLARHQTEQKRLSEVLKKLFGNSLPTSSGLRDCATLEAFIRESMRMRPTVPIGMRVPEEDVTIGGVHIPAGTTMLPYLDFRPGTEEHFGPDPDVFRPDRFLGESEAAIRARRKFDRFGGSARLCVGMLFAQTELRAFTARIIQKYTIELADPHMPEPCMIYEAGVYQPRDHFHFIFKNR